MVRQWCIERDGAMTMARTHLPASPHSTPHTTHTWNTSCFTVSSRSLKRCTSTGATWG